MQTFNAQNIGDWPMRQRYKYVVPFLTNLNLECVTVTERYLNIYFIFNVTTEIGEDKEETNNKNEIRL